MISYVCDGSQSGTKMGAGIVRIDQSHVEQYHFTKSCKLNENTHETFAILHTLSLIEQNQDTQCVIFNDCKMTLSALYAKQQTKRTNKVKIASIQEKLSLLEEKGYIIEIKHTSALPFPRFLQVAHHLSRLYMNKNAINPKVTLDLTTKTTCSIHLTDYPYIELTQQTNDEIFKKNALLGKAILSLEKGQPRGFLLSASSIPVFNSLIFQKISKKTWLVLNKELTPLFAGSLLDAAYELIKHFSEQSNADFLSVNEQFLHHFLAYCQSAPQITRPMYVKMDYVLSFINNRFLTTYEDTLLDFQNQTKEE